MKYTIPIYSSNDSLLALLPLENGLRRQFLPIEQLPKELRTLLFQSEDRRYYFHGGVDLFALSRAIFFYLKSGSIDSGASTITMQLVRLINPREKGVLGKFFEIFDAVRLESRLSKKKILELYINHLPFGSNIEGIESAAYYFFKKEAKDLSKEELLILLMVPRRPEVFNPIQYKDFNREAVVRTLKRVKEHISLSKVDEAYKSMSKSGNHWPSKAHHFINLVKSHMTEDMWLKGEALYTTLDDKFQSAAETTISDVIVETKENRITNGSLLAIDNRSGSILAYVGSADFYDASIQGQIDGVRILRQPGSTLKPFLYAKAIESGFSPSDPLPDIPMEFGHSEVYIPENYNERYNGPVRLSVALGSSLNVPSVYLLERLGVKSFLDKLLGAGFKSLKNKESLGVGLALGNGEVSLWELVQGFSIFSREGRFLPISYFVSEGTVADGLQVYPAEVSEQIRFILSNKQNRILGFGRTSPLEVNFDALFKTGTSNQFNNIWALGSSQDMTIGVWMGNFSGETVIGTPGSSYPARIVVSLLEEFHKEDSFDSSVYLEKREICSLSGDLAGNQCYYTIKELFAKETQKEICLWHRDKQVYLPALYSQWSHIYRQSFQFDKSQSSLEILQPKDGALFYIDPTLKGETQAILIRIIGKNEASLYVNEQFRMKDSVPYEYMLKLERGELLIKIEENAESHEIKIYVK